MLRKLPKIDKKVFTWTTLSEIVLAATFFCIASVMFLMSSRKTLYSHTMTLANSGGIILILVNAIRLIPINRYEIIGTIVVVCGIFALINDSESTKAEGSTNILLGDTFALISMPCYTLAFVFNSRAIQKLPSLVVFHCFSVVQLVLFTTYILIFSGIEMQVLFSRDPIGGLFGWSDPNWILLSTLIIAPICGVLGVGCYVFLLDFFPPHIVNGIFLLEPFVGQLIGTLLGQDGWPTVFTYIGALLVTIGLGFTIMGNAKTKDKEGVPKEILDIELSQSSLL